MAGRPAPPYSARSGFEFVEKESDWTVTTVTETDPDVAVQTVEDTEFDCIISGDEMAPIDGLAFFDAVREPDADAPFVRLTGKGSEEIASQALNAGVTGYFRKGGPDRLRRLANRVRQTLGDHRTRRI